MNYILKGQIKKLIVYMKLLKNMKMILEKIHL